MDVLQNIRKPLKLGYIMVKNRSHQELKSDISLAEARTSEAIFFQNHASFSTLDKMYFGVENPTTKLTHVLVDRIQDALPEISTEVSVALKETRSIMRKLGQPPPATAEEQRAKLIGVVQETTRLTGDVINGNYTHPIVLKSEGGQLCFYARAKQAFKVLQSDIQTLKPNFSSD